jgi:hypothetical protein
MVNKFMKKLFGLLFINFIIISCASINVNYDYDMSADFTPFYTYKWVGVSNKSFDKNFEDAINKSLATNGFAINNDRPDFLIKISDGKDGLINSKGWTSSWKNVTMKDSCLVVDVLNAKNSRLVWRGWMKIPTSKNKEVLNEAAAEMFSNFPPDDD